MSENLADCAKVRVIPAEGLTAPRTELNGSVGLGRTVGNVIPSMPEKPCRDTLIWELQCTISALESLGANFANRILNLEKNMKSWGSRWNRTR